MEDFRLWGYLNSLFEGLIVWVGSCKVVGARAGKRGLLYGPGLDVYIDYSFQLGSKVDEDSTHTISSVLDSFENLQISTST